MSRERLLPFGNLERNEDEATTWTCFKPMRDRVLQLWKDSCNFSKKALEMGRNDPRKVIYSIKMGFALSLVSLFIFWKKPADVSQFSIWAILTVIVMFEFSIGSFASYMKLYPTMAPYEYGYRVFVLTFCILMVAGNRTREYTVAILSRLVLIAVGACICFIINICIYPIWAGDDLHRLVVNNFNELAASLEGCVDGYLKYVDYNRIPTRFMSQASGDQLYLGYKTVIESASREQTLLGFAVWEPPHGRYRTLRHPWRTYVKASGAVRHCAYTVMALHGCILSEIQAPPEKRQVFRSQLQRVSAEGAKVLRELGNKIEKMEKLGTDDNILKEVHEAGEQLQKKIDQRSFLLVNSESWEIGNHTKVLEDLGDLPSEREYETLQLGLKSLSETAIYVKSPLISTPRLPNKDLPKQKLRKHVPWPSWISFEGDGLIKEDEVKTYQSASALSLATFASLLIEFVARLQNVVDCFEELSEEAEFKDPNIIVLTTSASFWTRFLRCFSLKS
ncbi:UNVERIFIED_CONTAM: Aluminum-activated malate transporter 9 [Sesamum latifolium]|uniref:Aluminum-activated malate transporter 9 n=1 Tax=Sesamum latifolium TaxID=2727402 RepID=A0AAW2YD05_9LAMI